ncbi:DNA-binding protein [Stutzerimonas stutzeri]|uniref:helix-turn-helix transcriptional regulator n=1 Tax=Stutzerimonas stutzeri TaxID=316 RepID=UPI00387DCEE7
MKALLTVDDLSGYIHKSVTSIRSDVTRNPQSLPPICRLPGTKRLLWRVEDVERWLADHVSGSIDVAASVTAEASHSKPGRPRKSQQIKKQKIALLSSGVQSRNATAGA